MLQKKKQNKTKHCFEFMYQTLICYNWLSQDSPLLSLYFSRSGNPEGPNIRSHVCILLKKTYETEGLEEAGLCHEENMCLGVQRGSQIWIQTLFPGGVLLFKNIDSIFYSFKVYCKNYPFKSEKRVLKINKSKLLWSCIGHWTHSV